jgi:hypothetical protein
MSEINELQNIDEDDEQQEAPSATSPIVSASKSTASVVC